MDRQCDTSVVVPFPSTAVAALTCPFPLRNHPERARLYQATREWLAIFPEGDRLAAHRYDQLHAQMWPSASWERLWLANRLLLHMWWLDDILDDPTRSDAKSMAAAHRRVLMQTSKGSNDGSRLLAELLNEASGFMPGDRIQRVRGLYLAYLDTSLLQREQMANVTTLEAYLRLRPLMGGMFYATALSELAYDCPLPRQLEDHGWMYDLTSRVNRICCWANDVYAYAREVDDGETFNLVTILHTHHGLTVKQAMETVTQLIEAELMGLRLLAVSTPSDHTQRYLQGLKDMVAAILAWSAHTLRYA
jgi:hypothetical protein